MPDKSFEIHNLATIPVYTTRFNNGCTYNGRLQALFDFRMPFKPAWHGRVWRHRVRQFYDVIADCCGKPVAEQWLDNLPQWTSHFLSIIPRFDKGRLLNKADVKVHPLSDAKMKLYRFNAVCHRLWPYWPQVLRDG